VHSEEVSSEGSLAESLSCAKEPTADLATRVRDGYTTSQRQTKEMAMSWATPTLVEICIGLEINGYLPAEF
jgi:coenzyme PQQ precursor peptide PqqA